MGEWLTTIRFEALTYFFQGVTFLGDSTFYYLFLPIIYWCWKKRFAVYLTALVIVSAYLNYLLKNLIGWERPPAELWLVNAAGFTFPSTHAVLAAITWGYLAYAVRKKWFTITAIILIVLIAFSRVYLGVHYPQDVLAGLAVGTAFLHAYRFALKWLKPKLAKLNDIIKGAALIGITIGMLLIQPNTMIASGMGLLAGVYVGFLLEPHFADFDTAGKWLQQILKAVSGLLISLAVWQGVDWVFPNEPSFKYFQFFILGIWVTTGAPWMFIQLRLAKREP